LSVFYTECLYAECHYDKCRYAQCRGTYQNKEIISLFIQIHHFFKNTVRDFCP